MDNPSSSSSQEFCLKWNNYSTNLGNMFAQMISDESFVDVTLACEGLFIKAHKVVLSACSNYFRELLMANPCKHPIIIMKDIKMNDLRTIVNFMYKGEVRIFQPQLQSILSTAKILQVKGLIQDENDMFDNEQFDECINKQKTKSNQFSTSSIDLCNNSRRKRRRKKIKKITNENGNDFHVSASESESASEPEEMPIITKRVNSSEQRINNFNHSNTSSSSILIDANHDSNSSSRKRLYQNKSNASIIAGEQLSSNALDDNDYALEDSSDWHDNEQILAIQNTGDGEDFDGLIDVKPIVSFDEGSVGSEINCGPLNSGSLMVPSDYNALIPYQTENPPPGKVCACHLCHLTFTAYSSLRRHMQRHIADPERHKCDICLKSYSRKDYLKEHKKLKHPS